MQQILGLLSGLNSRHTNWRSSRIKWRISLPRQSFPMTLTTHRKPSPTQVVQLRLMDSTNQSINQSINQSFNQSINQSINQSKILIFSPQEMLLAFSTGVMKKGDDTYDITEWTVLFDDSDGSLSFGLKCQNQYPPGHRFHVCFKKFYDRVFVNLHSQLGESARIYFATRSIFGSTFQ